jgi:hypothetical protein
MAKNKDKKGKKARAPKAVAGVKLPKKLRKPIGQAVEWLQSPLAKEIVAAALVAAASALVTRRDDHEKSSTASTPSRGRGSGDVAGLVAQGIAAFVGGLAQSTPKPNGAPQRPTGEEPRSVPKLVP